MYATLLLIAAYLLGSIPFAVVVTRLFGMADPRTYGSGNPGATNVLRSGNKLAAILTLLGDALKGWLAVFLAASLAPALGLSGTEVAAAGLAAFLGHLYPVFLGFKGGKGVATSIGVLLGLFWPLALVFAAVWIAMAAAFRISSLAALTASAVSPVAAYVLGRADLTLPAAIMAVAVVVTHRANIRRLLKGEEPRIGRSKPA